MARDRDRQHMVWFRENGERIGAASFCTYGSEGGKCFILDFWVFPRFRGNGTGHRCFEALERYTKADGAVFYELNSTKEASIRSRPISWWPIPPVPKRRSVLRFPHR